MCTSFFRIRKKPRVGTELKQIRSFIPIAPTGEAPSAPIHFKTDLVSFWPSGDAGKRFVFAPCGQCEDCRNASRYSWAWRLASEVQYYMRERKYHLGFITLTYNDSSLPKIPGIFPEVAGFPCFSKDDIHKFVLYLRKTLHRQYLVTDLVYFVASEYGSKTQRPHYHMVIAWPDVGYVRVKRNGRYLLNPDGSYFRRSVPLSAKIIHTMIKGYWAEPLKDINGNVTRAPLGFVSPKHVQGGESLVSGRKILPFEVANLSDALNGAFYTAKYVTKDFYYMRELYGSLSDELLSYYNSSVFAAREGFRLRDFTPFHVQSKSLGFESIAHLTDLQRLDLLTNGRCLLGSDRLSMPPMYIQNKILFKPCYLINADGTRVVRRELTQFYRDNLELILSKKVAYYDKVFEAFKDNQYWVTSGVDYSFHLSDIASEFRDVFGGRLNGHVLYSELKRYGVPDGVYTPASFFSAVDIRSFFGCSLSEAYVFYFGVSHQFCFRDKLETFRNRYRHPAFTRKWDLIPDREYFHIQDFFKFAFRFLEWKTKSVPDETVDFVRDSANQLVCPQSEVLNVHSAS